MATTREFALAKSVSKISSLAIQTAGTPGATSKVCAAVQAFHKEVADLKARLNEKKSLCRGQAPPKTEMADAFAKTVRNTWKDICR